MFQGLTSALNVSYLVGRDRTTGNSMIARYTNYMFLGYTFIMAYYVTLETVLCCGYIFIFVIY